MMASSDVMAITKWSIQAPLSKKKRACCSTSTSTNRATSCFARCASSASKASYRSPGLTYRLRALTALDQEQKSGGSGGDAEGGGGLGRGMLAISVRFLCRKFRKEA